jgi:hypothetical protein
MSALKVLEGHEEGTGGSEGQARIPVMDVRRMLNSLRRLERRLGKTSREVRDVIDALARYAPDEEQGSCP